MENTGQSTLFDETGRLVGFGFGPHPTSAHKSINMVVYKTVKMWVICLSEPFGKGNPDALRPHLGTDVPGKDFARYAVRGVEVKFPFPELKKLLTEAGVESKSEMKWEWVDHA